jgi:hypothetical protein
MHTCRQHTQQQSIHLSAYELFSRNCWLASSVQQQLCSEGAECCVAPLNYLRLQHTTHSVQHFVELHSRSCAHIHACVLSTESLQQPHGQHVLAVPCSDYGATWCVSGASDMSQAKRLPAAQQLPCTAKCRQWVTRRTSSRAC